jgi:aminoglycoside phosphotransferase (APT) family kinase protein
MTVPGSDVRIVAGSREPLVGGACQEMFRVEVEAPDGSRRPMVLRSDAASSLPGSLPRRIEYRVIRAAVAAGVTTPAVAGLGEDLVRPGASAYLMEWVDGVTIARKLLRDPALAAARERLPDQLARELATIHSITPDADDLGLPVPESAAGAALAMHGDALARLPEPRPVIELALRHLADNRPPDQPLRLCHGDFRTGNFAVTPDGLAGVLDWEFAHWGDPYDDLAWLSVRDWRFGQLDRPIGGLCDRAHFYAAYRRESGRSVDPARVRYWEIMNNVRWTLGAIHQGERYLSGAEDDLELIAIGRRVVQLEYEILRLLAEE